MYSTWSAASFISVVSFSGQGDDDAGTGFHLFQVRSCLFVAHHRELIVRIAGRDDHDWQVFVDQGIRTVLHLASRVAFRVDVGDFFQLQRAFEGDRIMYATAQKKEILRADVLFCQMLAIRRA